MCMLYFTAIEVNTRVLSECKSSLKRQILCTVPTLKTIFTHNIHWTKQFSDFGAIMRVQMGDMSKLG
jgi:hypothetical protein